jgi:Cupredoxin-like domain
MRFILAVVTFAFSTGLACAADPPGFSLTIRDHRFTPTELEVPAGQKIELHIINADQTPAEFESAELHREKVVTGGQEIVVFIGPLRAGSYEFFDDFNPTTARGHIVAR